MFFNPRPTDEELSKLYADYRSEEYQKQRYRHEKWYTAEINQSIGKNSVEVMNRKANLRTILQSLMNLQDIESVLDYGGDSGQYIIDELIHAEKWVYDISNAPLLPGIKRLNNLEDNRILKFDLIMCCHVLEHVPYPLEIVERIKELSHKDTIFYFELPYKAPWFSKSVIKQGINRLFYIHPNLTKFAYRQHLMHRTQMHEHINYFLPSSLANMLEICGLKVRYLESKQINVGRGTARISKLRRFIKVK